MKQEKVCVYTCITGDYDKLQHIEKEANIDYICFTNNKALLSKEWKIVYVDDTDNIGNMLLSRKIKILGHKILRDYDISIWIDGAIQIKGNLRDFLEKYCCLDRYNMACFRHRVRDCVYDEAVACIIHRKENKDAIIKYMNFITQENFPKHFGLAECTIMTRRHNDEIVRRTMELWFGLLCEYAKRDQLTFPYCIYKTGLKIHWINLNAFDNPWFFWRAHKQLKETNVARVFFGEYKDIYRDYYEDILLERLNDQCKITINVPQHCNEISINIGKHFGSAIINFITNNEKVKVDFFPGISISNGAVFDYDDMVIYLKGNFEINTLVCCEFAIKKLTDIKTINIEEEIVDRYYYDKIVRDNMIQVLNQRCKQLDMELLQYDNVKETPIFWKISSLCERQDLIAKIIRKMIMKFI